MPRSKGFSDLAKAAGVSRAAAKKMVDSGRAKLPANPTRKQVQQAAADAAANSRPRIDQLGGNIAGKARDAYAVRRAQREKLECDRVEFDLAIRRGEYVPVGPVRSLLSGLAIAVQNIFQRMILEQADEIAPEAPVEFKTRAQEYLDRALFEISEAVRRM